MDEISIIIPVYNEEDNIIPLYEKLVEDLNLINIKYELIFINDGSNDDSLQKLFYLMKKDQDIKVINLKKNFGKSIALQTGFQNASGNIAITMDGDLQDDSKEIRKFLEKISEGYGLVSGWKYPRLDPISKTLPSKLFNYLTAKLTGVPIHDFNCGFKAYSKELYKSLSLYGEMHRYTPVLADRAGFRVTEIQVKHHPRNAGKSKYGYSRLIKGSFDLITVLFLTKYVNRPLHVFGIPGLIAICFGVIIGMYLIIIQYFFNATIGERPLLLLSILLVVLGFQFFSLGLIAEMIVYYKNEQNSLEQYIIQK